jgi:regulator of sirC expression with transglutaminase-like and TPR domain
MSGLRIEAPTPLQYFAALVADDTDFPLLEAAIACGQDDEPTLDVQGVLAEVDGLGERLKRRIPADSVALQRLRYLNRYFFQELAFGGNVNHYYDRRNSYLHEVLHMRRGIPITLALLYIELAQHAGLKALGVSFPGHFLVKLPMGRGEVVLDPFSGHSLSREDLEERLQPYRRQHGLTGDLEVPLGLFLQSAAPRDVLGRLLRNLKEIHRRNADVPRGLAVQHRLVALFPQAWEERRDRGLLLAAAGQPAGAAQDLNMYLEHCGDAPDAPHIRQSLDALKPSPLH